MTVKDNKNAFRKLRKNNCGFKRVQNSFKHVKAIDNVTGTFAVDYVASGMETSGHIPSLSKRPLDLPPFLKNLHVRETNC